MEDKSPVSPNLSLSRVDSRRLNRRSGWHGSHHSYYISLSLEHVVLTMRNHPKLAAVMLWNDCVALSVNGTLTRLSKKLLSLNQQKNDMASND